MYSREHALVLMGNCVRANMRWNLGQTVPALAGDPTADIFFSHTLPASSSPSIFSCHQNCWMWEHRADTNEAEGCYIERATASDCIHNQMSKQVTNTVT